MGQHSKRRAGAAAEKKNRSARPRARVGAAPKPAAAPAGKSGDTCAQARGHERRRYKIRNLPVEIRDELDRRMRDASFKSFRALSAWLEAEGCYISATALHRYSRAFEARLESVRVATAEARAIVEQTAGDDHAMAEALMRLVQTHLFKVLCSLKERAKGSDSPNVHAVARSVAGLAKAAVTQERWIEHTRVKVNHAVAEAEESIEAACQSGLSEDVAEKIRSALMDAKL